MADRQPNIFETAAKVKADIEAHPKEEHAKVLRWVAESLGVTIGAFVTPAGAGASQSNPQHSAAPQHGNRSKDIRSFVQEKQPKSDNQYAAVVAYYYRFEAPEGERSETIDARMLQESTRLAGRNRLSHPPKTLQNALGQGYLDVVERGRFRVSTVGENLVAMTLPGGDASTTGRRNRKTGKKKTNRKKR